MIVVPYCWRDWMGAEKVLLWMGELDGRQDFECLVVGGKGVTQEMKSRVKAAAVGAFSMVTSVETSVVDDRPWPMGPNTMFKCVLGWMSHRRGGHFWWNEPDCVPLMGGWLKRLEAEYLRVGKPFMGCVTHRPTTHLTGCAMYPCDVHIYNYEMTVAEKFAFDCVAPEKTLKHTHHTELFHHEWDDEKGECPTFPTVGNLKRIRSDSVVYHRCKDLTLIDRLRERRNGSVDNNGETFGCQVVVEDYVIPQGFTSPQIEVEKDERPEIYTYYDPIPGGEDQTSLIELWSELWTKQGWKPVVLNRKVAERSLKYARYVETVGKFPTVNSLEYELACYIRHLAMFVVGGGLLTDYDVMPVKFTPEDAKSYKRTMTILEPTRVPCALIGKKSGFQSVVDFISGYKVTLKDVHGGKPHTSDMEILRKSAFSAASVCVEHLCSGSGKRDDLGDGWKTAKMIHFATGSFRKLGWTGTKRSMIERALKAL